MNVSPYPSQSFKKETPVSLKSVCTCLQKERDLGGDGRGEDVYFVCLFVFFTK